MLADHAVCLADLWFLVAIDQRPVDILKARVPGCQGLRGSLVRKAELVELDPSHSQC